MTYRVLIFSCLLLSGFFVQAEDSLQPLPTFSSLMVSNKIVIELVPSEKESYYFTRTEGILPEDIVFEVKGKQLKIRSKMDFGNSVKAHLIIHYQSLNRISVKNGADVRTGEAIQGKKMELKAYSGSNLELVLENEFTDTYLNSGATVVVKGKSDEQIVRINAGGTFAGEAFVVKETVAQVSAGGTIKVNTSEKLKASTTAGGTVLYTGEPKNVDKKTTMGGSINKL